MIPQITKDNFSRVRGKSAVVCDVVDRCPCRDCGGLMVNGVCNTCGFVRVCCACGKVRFKDGSARDVPHSDKNISHGFCGVCYEVYMAENRALAKEELAAR